MMLRISPWQFAGVTTPLTVFVPAGVFWFTEETTQRCSHRCGAAGSHSRRGPFSLAST